MTNRKILQNQSGSILSQTQKANEYESEILGQNTYMNVFVNNPRRQADLCEFIKKVCDNQLDQQQE